MVNIQALEPKLIGEIIKYVECPLNLIKTCKIIHKVSSIPWVRAEWAIIKFGRAHVLFHAVRLGPNFINVEVVDKILENGGVLSRYFIQRLVMHFGRYDKKLIELKIEHNIGQIDADRIRNFQQKIKSPWA
ncbi:15304_t:CDS:1, partial [Acaulospora morrowiae]